MRPLEKVWKQAFEQIPLPSNLVTIPSEDFVINTGRDQELLEDNFSLQVTAETLDALYHVKDSLPKGEQLGIVSAYRPADLLLGLWLRRMRTLSEQFPDWSIEKKVEVGSKYTASPYHPGFPPHSRGDAVDVMLYKGGEPIPLDKTATTPEQAYKQMQFDFFKDKDSEIHGNRLHLRESMCSAGFIPYDKEFWHFGLTPVFLEEKKE